MNKWIEASDPKGKKVLLDSKMVDSETSEIIGLARTGGRLGIMDDIFLTSMENRIRNSTKPIRRRDELGTMAELDRLASLGVEVELRFAEKLKSVKREGLLADHLLFEGTTEWGLESRTFKRVTALLRSAERIQLTENSAVRVGEAIRQYPEMLVDHGVFARTPFPTCWIEMPARAFHEAVVPGSDSDWADTRVGYLFHGNDVYVGAEDGKDNASWSPLSVHLHRGMSFQDELAFSELLGISRGALTQLYWGGTIGQSLDFRVAKKLREHHSVRMNLRDDLAQRASAVGPEWLASTAGEVRNIVGLLLMLNQPSIHQFERVGHGRKMTSKGSRVFMSHSILTINLDGRSKPSRLLRKPTGGPHASPRWHKVVDHWCNDYRARSQGYNTDDHRGNQSGHAHEWVADDDGDLRFTCQVCGGKRWRRKMKGRGDRSRGTISQERHVTTALDSIKKEMFS